MNETSSSAMSRSARGWCVRYRPRIGSPSSTATIPLLRFDSHQCGTQSGQTAIASSIATNGTTVYTGSAAAVVTVGRPPGSGLEPGQCSSLASISGGRRSIARGWVAWYIVVVYPEGGVAEGEQRDQGHHRARRVLRK